MRQLGRIAVGALVVALALTWADSASAQPGRKKRRKPPKATPIPRGTLDPNRRRVAPVNVSRTSAMRTAAAQIDALVEQNLQSRGLAPNPDATDYEFVRRAYLQIVGTIPTLRQVNEFADNQGSTKREALVDHLLGQPGYVSHQYNFWANLLRVVDAPNPNVPGQPFQEWIKDSIGENKPYDQFVREMLTAEGRIWENPATGYLLRDAGMPLDNLNNTVRVFLGTRIGCAQCHDHPFDRWEQRQFYELAAFVNGVSSRKSVRDPKTKKSATGRLQKAFEEAGFERKKLGAYNRVVRMQTFAISDAKRPMRLPHDYQYSDGKPGEVVSPKVIFGDQPKVGKGERPRVVFANWMTSKDNPRFALAISNRLWAYAMGESLLDSIDDIRDESESSNPELTRFLEEEMKRLDFNVKEFLRTIYNTRTFQRRSSSRGELAEQYHFPGPVLRRLTAEQIWDSVLTLAVYNPDGFERTSFDSFGDEMAFDLFQASADDVMRRSEVYNKKYSRGALNKADRTHAYKGQVLARASELPSPMPARHFLRQFGQGDREVIDGGYTDGSVTQILTMFNGPITHMMLEEGSVIYDSLLTAKDRKSQIDTIFKTILSRPASGVDAKIAAKEFLDGPEGYGNVIWALINTKEFLFLP